MFKRPLCNLQLVNETDNGSCKLGQSQNSASVPCPELDSLPGLRMGKAIQMHLIRALKQETMHQMRFKR